MLKKFKIKPHNMVKDINMKMNKGQVKDMLKTEKDK